MSCGAMVGDAVLTVAAAEDETAAARELDAVADDETADSSACR